EMVTREPETVNPYLGLSQDHKVIQLRDGIQNLPDTSRRFMTDLSFVGSQGFTSGRHCWDVEVGKGDGWAVGVALESMPRMDFFSLVRSGKIWALQLDKEGQYRTVHMSRVLLILGEKLQRIRIYLDYEAGRVTFYNAKNMSQILQFETVFTEKVFPYFWILSGEVRVS
ncbi:TRIM7 ligase, partial [Acrocephalus arundinaceus]|nr:TRIM7 ligase [Acrocephalus arundinaceus]